MNGSRYLALIAFGGALALSGCTDDSGDDSADTNTDTTDPTMGGTDSDPGTDTGSAGTAESTGMPTTDLSFATDIQPIFDANCVTECHESGGHWFYLDLTGNSYDTIVGEPGPTQAITMSLVEPGSTDESYMWHKLNGTHEDNGGPGTLQMPVEADAPPGSMPPPTYTTVPLPQEDLDTIEEWILGGAPP